MVTFADNDQYNRARPVFYSFLAPLTGLRIPQIGVTNDQPWLRDWKI
jgi:hypothetical protein